MVFYDSKLQYLSTLEAFLMSFCMSFAVTMFVSFWSTMFLFEFEIIFVLLFYNWDAIIRSMLFPNVCLISISMSYKSKPRNPRHFFCGWWRKRRLIAIDISTTCIISSIITGSIRKRPWYRSNCCCSRVSLEQNLVNDK